MRPADHSRDPVNDLYDRGCDLVEAARAIRLAAANPQATPAVPAVLGCIETALDELARASTGLALAADHAAEPHAGRHAGERLERSRRHLRSGLRNLEHGLRDARDLASAARALAARAFSRAGATHAGAPVR